MRLCLHVDVPVLQGLAVVAAALEAAGLLVPQGAYVEALDVLDELQAALDSGAVAGLHAFRSLPQQLACFGRVRRCHASA